MLAYTQNVTALSYVVFYIVVAALVCELSEANLLGGKLFIKVIQIKRGRGQFLQSRWEYCGLQCWHRGLKLGWDQCEGLMLHTNLGVELDCLRD